MTEEMWEELDFEQDDRHPNMMIHYKIRLSITKNSSLSQVCSAIANYKSRIREEFLIDRMRDFLNKVEGDGEEEEE